MYGMIAHIPFRGLIKSQVGKMMEKMYGPDCEMPMNNNSDKPSLPLCIGTGVLKLISKRK
ncbi:MAG: hypothetical protein DRH26_06275 [Deltaproteobacteria bacterium]|nr:MAG: hypothetical protein DRH26_06275 [Deltaproteobacteria bacterium]